MRNLLITIFLLFCIGAYANDKPNFKDSISVTTLVNDDFTNEVLGNVVVSIYDEHNNLIKQGKTRNWAGSNYNRPCNFEVFIPRNYNKIVVKAHVDGYEDFEGVYTIRIGMRKQNFSIPIIHLQKATKKIKEVKLDSITITASKVKMVMHGDTIVYNADAFQLSNGSMLDDLIRRLPGVQLKGSQIMVNGRFVSSLLVNGSDFFKGNSAIAMRNLPAYTVNKLKVYEKEDEITGFKKPKGQNPLVMDVSLKRMYMQGLLANTDFGYGTNNRWNAGIFAMRYTKNSRIGVVTNLNNINDARQPGSTDEMRPSMLSDGSITQRTFGVDYQINDNEKTFRFYGNLKLADI